MPAITKFYIAFALAVLFLRKNTAKVLFGETTGGIIMERTKCCLSLIFLFLFFLLSEASDRDRVYHAYITDQMDEWRETVDSLELIKNLTDHKQFELLNYYYGYWAWCISTDRNKEAKEIEERALDCLDLIKKRKIDPATCMAYESSFLGFRIALRPIKAAFLGPRSLELIDHAYDTDSLNWFVQFQLGNSLFYRPKLFGGSDESALHHFLKALDLMEKKGHSFLFENWNYLSLLIVVAKCYYSMGNSKESFRYIDKALFIAPEFDYVRRIKESFVNGEPQKVYYRVKKNDNS